MPETNKGLSTTSTLLPFEIPKRFIDIQDSVTDTVSTYMPVVIKIGTSGREVDVEKIINNAKMMFRDGVKYHDKLWLQHCASSIREIISFINSEDYYKAFKDIPTREDDPQINKMFTFLDQANAYLSDIVHFRESAKLGNCERLYPKQGYGQMTKDDFLKNEEKTLERVCIDIVSTINEIFSRYCLKK